MPQTPRKPLKLLYAIQGTGNGHVARAIDLVPIFKTYARVDVLISGIQADLEVPFEVKYRLKGLSFIFGKRGGINFLKMLQEVSLVNFLHEVNALDLSGYDLLINDFEPVSSLAAKRQHVPCVQVSHQVAVIQPEAPRPAKTDWAGNWILHHYATGNHAFGFHFNPYTKNTFTPIIRAQVRKLKNLPEGKHYTVYLPAFSDAYLLAIFRCFPDVEWEVFSKKATKAYVTDGIRVYPVSGQDFVRSMAKSRGVICGAGFETPAECLFLGKKLLAIPMHGQYEQQCNARALELMGVKVLPAFHKKYVPEIKQWLDDGEALHMDYPDNAKDAVQQILEYVDQNILIHA